MTFAAIFSPLLPPVLQRWLGWGRLGTAESMFSCSVAPAVARGFRYQYSFNPPCIWRGELDWPEITPNVLLLRLVCGPAKHHAIEDVERLGSEIDANSFVHAEGFRQG
jgi:hypothetical protein